MSSRVLDVATLIAAVAAIVMAVNLTVARVSDSPTREDRTVDDWLRYATEGHHMGAEDPSLVVIEWGDYECPACRGFHRQISAVMHKYPEDVRLVYRHWPLRSHRSAYPAARAAECAARQGVFEEFHRRLLEDSNWLGEAFNHFAVGAGVEDMARFEECLRDTTRVPVIERDIAAVKRLGGRGTPTLLVNGVHVASIPDSLELERLLLEARRR